MVSMLAISRLIPTDTGPSARKRKYYSNSDYERISLIALPKYSTTRLTLPWF